MRTLTKEQVLSVAVDNNLPMPEISSGDASSINYTTLGGNLFSSGLNITSRPVLCKDGTTKMQSSSPNAIILDACRDNGGRAENQIAVAPTSEIVKQQNLLKMQNMGMGVLTAEDKFYEMLGIKKTSGGWGIQSRPLGRLLVAVVLVGGYFAYKKFKK
jgi:hypothetical protein